MDRHHPTMRSAQGARLVRASVAIGLAVSVGLQWAGADSSAPAPAGGSAADCGNAAIRPLGAL